MERWIVACLIAYLAGSFPSGYLVGRITRGIDIRARGSGSSGGTNAVRVLGWKAGGVVIVLDGAKGWLATTVGMAIAGSAEIGLLCGTCAVLGHIYPVFTGFRGGKGVAPSAGVLLAVEPLAFVVCAVTFVAVLLITRTVSTASIGATLVLPPVLAIARWFPGWPVPGMLIAFSLVLAVLIPFAHRDNIRRLVAGQEPTIDGTRGDSGRLKGPGSEPKF